MSKKTALIILDGFGIIPEKRGNAVILAKKPIFDSLIRQYPKCLLKTSSEEVGLPWGEFGNSEVGHTNIGLGRVVLQDLPQIDKALENIPDFIKKQSISSAIDHVKNSGGNLNLIFLASDGGVHGHIRHIPAIISAFRTAIPDLKINLHLISDGRDTGEKSILRYIKQIEPFLDEKTIVRSLSGRFYAMDRDKNYDRTEKAFSAICGNSLAAAQNIQQAVDSAYGRDETDEFITPVAIGKNASDLKRDAFFFTNYRADRALQLTRAFTDLSTDINSNRQIADLFLTMTTYDDNLNAKAVFSNLDLYNKDKNSVLYPLPEIISKSGLKQFHVAETEKFAHVTYFFSGGVREPFENQTNKIIPSKKVRTYDQCPQMSAKEISGEIIRSSSEGFDFIVANYANADMVGHTGNLNSTIAAVEFIDKCLAEVIPPLLKNGFSVFLTSDHGNADQMIDLKNGKPDKEHSINPAPLIYISQKLNGGSIKISNFYAAEPIGVLADVAPTILGELEIPCPNEFTGINLINSLS